MVTLTAKHLAMGGMLQNTALALGEGIISDNTKVVAFRRVPDVQ